jgi:hypothetical protein
MVEPPEAEMRQLVLVLAGFVYLYQGYKYPYYYEPPPVAAAPYHSPFVYNGVDRDFYNPSNESSWDRAWQLEQQGLR